MPDWVSKMDHGLIDTLDSHFHCLGERVNCARVKPCLPGLLIPSVHLRIPTPITVHIDQCRACAADLGVLRKLTLDARRLARLQWLYSQRPEHHPLLCCRARAHIRTFVAGGWERIDDKTLEHLCACPRCRTEVYAYRQHVLNEHLSLRRRRRPSPDMLLTSPANDGRVAGPVLGEEPGLTRDCCDVVGIGELFDYVVPSGSVERADAAHVGACPQCLEKIQRLHRVVYGIAERPESGVATVYTTVDDADPNVAEADDPYARYAIRVQVARDEAQPAVAVASGERNARPRQEKRRYASGMGRLRQAGCNPRVRMMLKTAVTAAAVIPLGLLFLSTPSSSTGITLGEVVRAFEQAANVHVLGYGPVGGQVAYELWISRDLDLVRMARPGECVIYDLGWMKKNVVAPDSEQEEIISMSAHECAGVRKMVADLLGITLANVRSDTQLDQVRRANGQEVYELSGMSQISGNPALEEKYEIVVDRATSLPISVSLARRNSRAQEWRHSSQIMFEYLSDAEMKSAIESTHHASIGTPP